MTVAEIQELVPTLAVTVEPVGRLQESPFCRAMMDFMR